MWMRDVDRGNAAHGLNLGHRIAVDEANAIPKNVSSAILNQESTLADGELGLGANAPNPWTLRIERVTVPGS